MNKIKSFASIPGPYSWPIFGTLPYYLWSPIKKYDFKRLDQNGFKKYEEFGPIVRESIAPGVNILWLFEPDDIKKMFQYDGQCPARRSHLALQKYRKDRPHLYNTGGLLPTNGMEWMRIRQALQRPLNVPKSLDTFQEPFNQIATEFVESISGYSEDFVENLKRYFLEITGFFTLDIRLGAMREDEVSNENSTTSLLIKSAFQTNSNILLTDNGLPFWKMFDTKEYKAISEGQSYIEKIALKHVRNKMDSLQNEKASPSSPQTLLEHYLLTDRLDEKDILTMVCDSLLAGIDTSSYTSGFMFYYLAKNPDEQSRLREHIRNTLPSDKSFKNFPYGRAVLKETLRLNPVSVGIGRVCETSDAVFSGYSVPKGTVLVSQNQISCRLEKYFDQPLRFMPERWLAKTHKYHPYLVLPFGFGPRMCIGRRIAEMSILHLLKELIKRYEIRLHDPELELGCRSYLINCPDKPLPLKFTRI